MFLISSRTGFVAKDVRSTRRTASLLLLGAAGLLAASLLFPMWHIKLGAPQYPEGLGMFIWPNGIHGQSPNDLDIINELNHYIGMKKIMPDQIPELRLIPKLIWLFTGLILLIALRPRRWLVTGLLAAFSGAGMIGIWDFWSWEYDYGHHLNPHAAIIVPGMSYQPPLIGTAHLLNFTSQSWPALGAWLMFGSGALMAAAVWILWLRRLGLPVGADGRSPLRGKIALSLISAWGLTACNQGPVPLEYGSDACHFCKMTLVQTGFGAERITAKGKVYKFDSMECLLGSLKTESAAGDHFYAIDFNHPGNLIPVENLTYLRSANLKSPMGAGLSAFASTDSARIYQARFGGDLVTFDDLRKS